MKLLAVGAVLLCAACPPPSTGTRDQRGGGGGAAGGAGINPDGCGRINTNKIGAKVYAFLVASSELDRTSLELEGTVRSACKRMALDLGTSGDGTTKEVCDRATQALQANLQVSVKSEKRLVTRYTPPVCHTDVSLEASFAAQCEGGGSATATPAGGVANASAECRAAAEVHAQTHTTCTEAKVEVVSQDVTIVDDSKFKKAVLAIQDGLPDILRSAKRLELATVALAHWVDSGAQLVAASGDLVAQLGEKGLCVGAQLAGVVAASTQIQARFSVSVEVSASVSGSAGATAQ